MAYDAQKFLTGLFQPEAELPDLDGIGPDDLPDEWQDYYGERAAIREYDGGYPKEHAEMLALNDTIEYLASIGVKVTKRLRRF